MSSTSLRWRQPRPAVELRSCPIAGGRIVSRSSRAPRRERRSRARVLGVPVRDRTSLGSRPHARRGTSSCSAARDRAGVIGCGTLILSLPRRGSVGISCSVASCVRLAHRASAEKVVSRCHLRVSLLGSYGHTRPPSADSIGSSCLSLRPLYGFDQGSSIRASSSSSPKGALHIPRAAGADTPWQGSRETRDSCSAQTVLVPDPRCVCSRHRIRGARLEPRSASPSPTPRTCARRQGGITSTAFTRDRTPACAGSNDYCRFSAPPSRTRACSMRPQHGSGL